MRVKRRIEATLLFLSLSLSFWGCAASSTKTLPGVTVRIESNPPGAFASYCPYLQFSESAAIPLGKTPLMRFQPSFQPGIVQLTFRGYRPWTGPISPDSPSIQAELVPMTNEEREAKGWSVTTTFPRIDIVPVRIGTRQIGGDFKPDTPAFRSRFLAAFHTKLEQRFATKVALKEVAPLNGNEGLLQGLDRRMQGLDVAQISTSPTPLLVDVPQESRAHLASFDGGILLVRAEAHYLGTGSKIARVTIPLLLTAAAAAGGVAAVSNLPAGVTVTIPVFGPGPNEQIVLAQGFLLHQKTQELLWFGEVRAAADYETDGLVEDLASRLAEQVPSAFIEKQPPEERPR